MELKLFLAYYKMAKRPDIVHKPIVIEAENRRDAEVLAKYKVDVRTNREYVVKRVEPSPRYVIIQ